MKDIEKMYEDSVNAEATVDNELEPILRLETFLFGTLRVFKADFYGPQDLNNNGLLNVFVYVSHFIWALLFCKEGGDIGLFITLVPKV